MLVNPIEFNIYSANQIKYSKYDYIYVVLGWLYLQLYEYSLWNFSAPGHYTNQCWLNNIPYWMISLLGADHHKSLQL